MSGVTPEQASYRVAPAIAFPMGDFTLDMLLALCPDEPLADLDELDLRWMTAKEHARWWELGRRAAYAISGLPKGLLVISNI